jgi:hypothetical protein
MPASCVLRTRRPSPTTVSFTVSTRSPQRGPARILHHALLLLRFLTACETLLLLWYKYATSVGSIPPWISSSAPGAMAQSFARSLPARYLMPGALVCLWMLTKRGYTGMSDPSVFGKTKLGRGVTAGVAWSGDSNDEFVRHVLVDCRNAFHSYDVYPGHLYPRSI